jgi:hypothetical protein
MKRLIQVINRLFAEKAPETRMSTGDVRTVARLYMEARGGRLEEPVYLSVSAEGRSKRLVWLVRDNADNFGGNVYLRIDDATGEVLDYRVPGSASQEHEDNG